MTLLPITHVEPKTRELAVEIPAVVKQRLGLVAERSWIVVDEANRFIWPGPDLRRLPGGDQSTVAYGVPRLFEAVRVRFLAAARVRRVHTGGAANRLSGGNSILPAPNDENMHAAPYLPHLPQPGIPLRFGSASHALMRETNSQTSSFVGVKYPVAAGSSPMR